MSQNVLDDRKIRNEKGNTGKQNEQRMMDGFDESWVLLNVLRDRKAEQRGKKFKKKKKLTHIEAKQTKK